MSTLDSVILEGPAASIPAASIPGRLYFATDTFQIYRDNGSVWGVVTPNLSGVAGGDLSGSYPDPTVIKINGATVGDIVIYNASAFDAAGTAASAAATVSAASLQAVNNLSDLPSIATARLNLGFGSGNPVLSVNGEVGTVLLASTQLTDSALLARLASPELSGVPTAPTPAASDNSNTLATTAYVQAQVSLFDPAGAAATALASAEVFSSNANNLTSGIVSVTLLPAIPETLVTNLVANLAAAEQLANKGVANGYASLDATGLIPSSQMPPLAISQTYVVSSQAAMLALAGDVGDVAIRTDINETFILQTKPASTLGNWQQILTPASPVQSVNGLVGVVSLASTNLTDTALLARLASPAFSGTPTAPTPATADSSTKLATTAYVQAQAASYSPVASGPQGLVLATPAAATGTASLRALVANDLPGTMNTTSFSGNLTVTGQVNMQSTLTVTSMMSSGGITTSGFSATTGNFSSTLAVSGLATLSGGAAVTGNLTVSGTITVRGTALAPSATTDTTNASNITSGTLAAARIPALPYDASGAATTAQANAIAAAEAFSANASNISSGTLAAARLPGTMNATGFSGNVAITGTLTTTATAANSLQLDLTNGTAFMQHFSGTVAAAFANPITQAGDNLLLYGGAAAINSSSSALTIAPYSSTAGGLRMNSAGNVAITGTLTTSGNTIVTGYVEAIQTGSGTSSFYGTNGSAYVGIWAGTTTAGQSNPIVQAGDNMLGYSGTGAAGTGALVIAPYLNTAGGLRMNSAGNVAITGTLGVSAGATLTNTVANSTQLSLSSSVSTVGVYAGNTTASGIIQAADNAIFYTANGLAICPGSTTGGLRMDGSGNMVETGNLTVNGVTTINNELLVGLGNTLNVSGTTILTGAVTMSSTLAVTGNLNAKHFSGNSATPTLATTSNSTACTVSFVTGNGITSNDSCGMIQIVVGASNVLAGAAFLTLTFTTPYPAAPKVVISPANVNAPSALAMVSTTGPTQFTLLTTTAILSSGITYAWTYHVMS